MIGLGLLLSSVGCTVPITAVPVSMDTTPAASPTVPARDSQTPDATPVPTAATDEATNPAANFAAEVTRGDTFAHRLNTTLQFRLIPIEYGWTVEIGPPDDAALDFSQPVTPPFHSLNARRIEGWHFRNADNSGPNAPGPGNVNAPQHERVFCFVHHADDAALAQAWQADPETELPKMVMGRGVLTIDDLTLDNLTVGQQARIESMAFHVTIEFNADCDLLE